MLFRISFLKYFCLFFLFLRVLEVKAQEAKIILGDNRLPITEYFTISVKLQNEPIKEISEFPEIEGFQKSNRPKSRARITKAGKTTIEETISQNYAALKEGTYVLKPFTLKINGKDVASKGTTIIIQSEALKDKPLVPAPPESPAQVIGKNPEKTKSVSFLDVETNKNQIYAGEGLRVQLFFYLALAEQDLLDFYKFGDQLPQLIKKIKPRQVWEESSDPGEVKSDTLLVKGKTYIRFKLYESVYYPLSTEPLLLPSLTLAMVQRAKDQTYTLAPTQQDIVSFLSKAKTITVIALPPHPLRETVAVGQFQLQEGINKTGFTINKSFSYTFEVTGSGNLTALHLPDTLALAGLDIYPPQIQQFRNKTDGRAGRKTFKYTLLARQPGKYDLSQSFYLPFFNPVSGQYDTLRSSLNIQVTGAPKNQKTLKPEEADSFYKLIQASDNELQDINQMEEIKLYTNLVILLLICASLFIFLKK